MAIGDFSNLGFSVNDMLTAAKQIHEMALTVGDFRGRVSNGEYVVTEQALEKRKKNVISKYQFVDGG